MLTSFEIRWFYAGKLPATISDWFEQNELGGKLQAPEEREDMYLYSPGCEYLGIKLRQGRLEIKWRNAELDIVRLGEAVEGKLEKWAKWTCEDPSQESFKPEAVLGKSSWVSVKKVRSQRLYDSCAMEIAQLSVKGNDWWSLAFETVGAEDNKLEQLKNIATQPFQTYNGSVQAQDSYAYPTWLSLVI
ncbi:MAG TPA: hypothetical protein DEV81_00825 [Cyanobacteria bacterium UBA11049]|nr:hypothetical protein [Cyanobacteria bacterium UBA11049]